jgi:hypothetical protein
VINHSPSGSAPDPVLSTTMYNALFNSDSGAVVNELRQLLPDYLKQTQRRALNNYVEFQQKNQPASPVDTDICCIGRDISRAGRNVRFTDLHASCRDSHDQDCYAHRLMRATIQSPSFPEAPQASARWPRSALARPRAPKPRQTAARPPLLPSHACARPAPASVLPSP